MELPPDAAFASANSHVRSTAAAGRSNGSMGIVEIPHKTVQRITCMGSGFVGGKLF